mgnify:CR=1 FL=1
MYIIELLSEMVYKVYKSSRSQPARLFTERRQQECHTSFSIIDVNSAYLSWTAVEQLKNGADVDIRTIPAIIGGDRESRHGIVLAKSPSAKKFGIRTGEPVGKCVPQVSESSYGSAKSQDVQGV